MSTISAGNTTTTAFKVTADTTGSLIFTTSGSNITALTLDANQNATFAGGIASGGAAITSQQSYGGF